MIPLFMQIICGGCSIIRAQLGKDGLDSTLDAFLSDLQLIRDLLVGIPNGDQAQHADLCRRWCRSAPPTVGGKRPALCCRATSTPRFAGTGQPTRRKQNGRSSRFASSLATSSITDGSALQDRCAANTGAAKILPETLAILREDNRMLIGGNLRCGAK